MAHNTSLAEQLAAYQAGFKQRVAPARTAMMEAATADLRATGIEAQALQVGARAPEMTLSEPAREAVSAVAGRPLGRDLLSRRLVPLLQPGATGMAAASACPQASGGAPGGGVATDA